MAGKPKTKTIARPQTNPEKVIDYMAASDRKSVQIRSDVYDKIEPTLLRVTGYRVKITDFVTKAVEEKLMRLEAESAAGSNLRKTGTEN
jgi:hypothetical protein